SAPQPKSAPTDPATPPNTSSSPSTSVATRNLCTIAAHLSTPRNHSMPMQTNGETFSFADDTEPTKTVINHPQVLLDWLLQHWTKPTICIRDIYSYAPRPIRDEEIATSAAEALVRHGWLSELKAHRHDRRVWHIDRKPVIHPIVPAE